MLAYTALSEIAFLLPMQNQVNGMIKGESATYDEDRMNNPWNKDPDETGWLGLFHPLDVCGMLCNGGCLHVEHIM